MVALSSCRRTNHHQTLQYCYHTHVGTIVDDRAMGDKEALDGTLVPLFDALEMNCSCAIRVFKYYEWFTYRELIPSSNAILTSATINISYLLGTQLL